MAVTFLQQIRDRFYTQAQVRLPTFRWNLYPRVNHRTQICVYLKSEKQRDQFAQSKLYQYDFILGLLAYQFAPDNFLTIAMNDSAATHLAYEASHLDSPKIPWSLIEETFRGQWVELSDYEWRTDSPYPLRARVNFCASDRDQLISLMPKSSKKNETVILFVGIPGAVIEKTGQRGYL